MNKLELNVGDTVTIVCNEPNDVSEGKVVAEVENHYIVKCGKDLHNFTLEGKNTSNPRMYLRVNSEVFKEGDKVFSKTFGIGYVKDFSKSNFFVTFPRIHDRRSYNSKGRYMTDENSEDKAVHHISDKFEFVFGDRVEVSNKPDFSNSEALIFVEYSDNSPYPYRVMLIDGCTMDIRNFKYARLLDENAFIIKKICNNQ